MKKIKLQKHPDYALMKQSDVVSFFHMQMPDGYSLIQNTPTCPWNQK